MLQSILHEAIVILYEAIASIFGVNHGKAAVLGAISDVRHGLTRDRICSADPSGNPTLPQKSDLVDPCSAGLRRSH